MEREVAIVTGAGRGIGAATALALAQAGTRVVVAARVLADAQAVAATLPAARSLAVRCDVTSANDVAALMRATTAAFGPPTILINNAGVITPIGALHDTDPDAWTRAITINLGGAARMLHAVLPAMLAGGRGRVVNLSSGAAHRPLEGWSAYCAGKAGLAMLTRSTALEYGGRGVFAFGFAPGLVDTAMQVKIRASGVNPVSQIPRAALSDVAEPAAAIAFLCTSAADGLAGTEVDIRDPAFRALVGLPTRG